MQGAFGERKGLRRRLTAFVVIYAFLLAGALASHHQHGVPSACAESTLHHGIPGAHPAEAEPCDAPGGCLACLWTRAAVGGPAAAGPAVVSLQSAPHSIPVDEGGYRHLSALSHPSRGPPLSSL